MLPEALPDALPEALPLVLPEALVPDVPDVLGRDEDDVEPEPVPLVDPEALVLPEPETLPDEDDALPPPPLSLTCALQPARAIAPMKRGTAQNFLFIFPPPANFIRPSAECFSGRITARCV